MHKPSNLLNLQFIIDKTRDYMFTSNNMTAYLSSLHPSRNISTPKSCAASISSNKVQKKSPSTSMIYLPSEKDTLFWCFYIIKYGGGAYDLLGQHTFSEEKKKKIKLVELIRQNKTYIKAQKLRYKQIEEELVYQSSISISTFLCICALQNISVAIIQKRRYCYSIVDDHPQHFVEYMDNGWGLYTIDKKATQEKELYCQENYWYIHYWRKPLNGVSSYKIAALRDICNRLGLPTKHTLDNGKEKWIIKNDLYQSIKHVL